MILYYGEEELNQKKAVVLHSSTALKIIQVTE